MAETEMYQPLTSQQIEQLELQDCSAEDWSLVLVAPDFSASRVLHVQFDGNVHIGNQEGQVQCGEGLAKPAGIYNAYVANCTIGNGVRIANIGSHLANYQIDDGACIENVGTMETCTDATFGNGVEVETLNEGGGREVTLFNELSSQFAHLQCLVRWRPELTKRLADLSEQEAAMAHGGPGTIGKGASISSVAEIIDVAIGSEAKITGAASLKNGTILSSPEAPTLVGVGVVAEDFIMAEGAQVDSGAIVCKSFVGQGCQMGKQFSSEGSLFFANCEGFHGEACSVFAGPYSVTHHKSTLLIAGLFSFYNAGSGTNQSNHMYKLGPVHEGKLERGCKTGSFSYMMWPCRVGPFSVVLGKHTRTFDTRNFPFSHIEAKSNGRCEMVPGLYLSTVGTVRDGAKWPSRDRRKSLEKRDIIDFDVLSPLTVGRMLQGKIILEELSKTTDRSKSVITIKGAEVRRVLLRKGARFYKAGIEMYLQERLVSRLEAGEGTNEHESLSVAESAVLSEEWVDLSGQMMPLKRFEQLCDQIESGEIGSMKAMQTALLEIHDAYQKDEWAWVVWAYRQHFGASLTEMSLPDIRDAVTSWGELRTKYLRLILGDADKEFHPDTRTGFGLLDDQEQTNEDFLAVRGTFDDNKFVLQMREEIKEVARRAMRSGE